jgi:hypothetical protein
MLAAQDPGVATWRSGLSKPRQAAKATRHSPGSWLWASMKRGMVRVFVAGALAGMGDDP